MSKYTPEQLKEVGRILGLPQEKKWVAARDFTIKHNKWAKIEHDYYVEDIKKQRQLLKNEYGSSGDPNSGLRWGMRIPESVLAAIKMFDPEFDRTTESGKAKDADAQKKEWRRMMKVFPEYKILMKL